MTGKQRLLQLEFLAGVDTDPVRLVQYDAEMESLKPDDLIELENPAQVEVDKDGDSWEEIGCALKYNDLGHITKEIACVAMELTGENEGAEWHWICVMKSEPKFAYISGGCDYTGWN